MGDGGVSKKPSRPQPAIIYLLQFKGGLLKVGRTNEWDRRKKAHGDNGSDGYVDHILIEILSSTALIDAERISLERARSLFPTAQKNEWFLGYAHDLLPDVIDALDAAGIAHGSPTGPVLERTSLQWGMAPGSMAQWVEAIGLGEKSSARLLGIEVSELRRMNHEGAPPHIGMACWYLGWKIGRWQPQDVYSWETDAKGEAA